MEPQRTDRSYDVVIIGTGAGGASLAQRLAPTGKSILMLERGEHLPIEAENWDPRAVFIDHRYRARERWNDRKGRPFTPNINYWVGGNTIFYGAALYRFRKRDFEAVRHHGGKISPAWPIAYDDLAPYYQEAEELWQVRGLRGADPTDDAQAPPYAYPPLRHEPEIAELKAGLTNLGLKPFEMPVAVERFDEAPEASPCIRCRTCGGYPCLRESKGDGRKMVVRARQHNSVELITGARVTRLETDANGRQISAVVFQTESGEQRVKGDVVVLAAGAVNSAAILLASTDPAKGTNGLANRSDQVGRNYMFHLGSASLTFSTKRMHTDFPKTMALNDWYWGDPDGGFDFPMGHVQMLEFMHGDVLRGQLSNTIPAWMIPKGFADLLGHHILPFLVMTEDLPEARNRVKLGRDGQISLHYWHNNKKAHARLIGRFHSYMGKVGRLCKCLRGYEARLDAILPIYGTAHQCGTLRMGNDPKSSVVDANCRAHDIENLYVADTSVFCSSAAVNPALTCIANALRVGDHIAAL